MLLDERLLPQSCGVLLGMALLSSIPTILLVLTYQPKNKRKWLDPKVMSTSYKWAYHRVTWIRKGASVPVVVGHLLNSSGDDPKKAETCWTSINVTFHHCFLSGCYIPVGPPAGEAVSSQAEAAEVEIAAGQVLFGEDQLKGGWDGWVLQVFLEISQFKVVWFATTPNTKQGFLNLGLALFADPRCWLGDTIPFTTWPQNSPDPWSTWPWPKAMAIPLRRTREANAPPSNQWLRLWKILRVCLESQPMELVTQLVAWSSPHHFKTPSKTQPKNTPPANAGLV